MLRAMSFLKDSTFLSSFLNELPLDQLVARRVVMMNYKNSC